jgi:hypothetical protein
VQSRHHYEQAFEQYLRVRRLPYVSVNEARKTLLPVPSGSDGLESLKSFDFVIYGPDQNLLVDIKGRKIASRRAKKGRRSGPAPADLPKLLPLPEPPRPPATRLECWVTEDDIASLTAWEGLFGQGFRAAFVFVYWCDQQPPAPLFEELLEFRGRWYAIRTVLLQDYRRAMKPRSPRWRTVHMPAAAFDRACRPLAEPDGPRGPGPGPAGVQMGVLPGTIGSAAGDAPGGAAKGP